MVRTILHLNSPSRAASRSATKAYLVGGGIASMAAAAFMIRDGDLLGHNITIALARNPCATREKQAERRGKLYRCQW